jgi:hypothetical protein
MLRGGTRISRSFSSRPPERRRFWQIHMDRTQAQAEILQLATDYRGASVLDYDTAKAVLGEERFAKMMADNIRNQPRAGRCVYFWNVLDAAMAMEGGKVVYRLDSAR